MNDALERAIRDAVSAGDTAQIAQAYLMVADEAEIAGDMDRACFFLTHAWVFALEAGDSLAETCRGRLASQGRV